MERDLISWLKNRYGDLGLIDTSDRAGERLGIGDDAAVLDIADRRLVVTSDAICEGTHFRLSEMTPEQIGRKALAVNLSDLAAMGARPDSVLVSLLLPRPATLEFAKRLFAGMDPLLEEYRIGLIGGDTTTWDSGLAISVTAIGHSSRTGPWTIDGARPGDRIVVTGRFGGSILKQHWAFQPRLDVAKIFFDRDHAIHACTDVSDSLSIDLGLMAESSGVGFEIDENAVPIANDAVILSEKDGIEPIQHALNDGEDFQLILAVDPHRAGETVRQLASIVEASDIGKFTAETKFVSNRDGQKVKFVCEGYQHR